MTSPENVDWTQWPDVRQYGSKRVVFKCGLPLCFEGETPPKIDSSKLRGALYDWITFGPKCGLKDCFSCERDATIQIAAARNLLELLGALLPETVTIEPLNLPEDP